MGVCGAGNFARKVLLPALDSTGRVQWESIATATGVTARHVGEAKGFRRAVGSAADVTTDPDVDAVLIATRHDTHAALVRAAVEAGKQVYVEKPLAVTPSELESLEGLNGLDAVTTGFNRRVAPATVAIADRLRSRREPLVAEVRINAGRLPKGHWADTPEQGGRIVGEVCHFIDLVCALAMSSVRRVTAWGSGRRTPEEEDTLQVLLDMYDGSSSTVSYLANGASSLSKERVELHWEGRSAVIDDFRTWQFYDGKREVKGGSRHQDKGHGELVSAFVSTAIDGGPNPVPALQAVHVTRASFAIVESLRTGGSVVLEREGW
jgi:polar amino acid transport system substrate-binding protein